MDELEFNKRRHVPAFGSWDCNGDLPFTQCFETAREAGERDLYVAGDLYDSDGFTPAMIVVPRHRGKISRNKDGKKKKGRVVWNCEFKLKTPPSPAESPAVATPRRPPPKAADEDLYKISPDLLRAQSKRKRGWKLLWSCLPPCA
ncbi:uncharacterized protein LOC121761301 [Salvia splendens]|uniref:uncharacterized protein LOC121761301 n=1 Tax=Salvia splendens TaxID=180675 RepID=UPI001C260D45|nr:uncharacterized protein LOC121761301 [Salvia splendens]